MRWGVALVIGAVCALVGFDWRGVVAVVIALACLFLYTIYKHQDQLLYQPKAFPDYLIPSQNPAPYRSPADLNMEHFEDVYLTTPDGVKLHAWHIYHPEARLWPTVLYFQGNAANMGFCLPNIAQFYLGLKLNVFVLSYRGYGESQGAPSEEGLVSDAETAMEYLLSSPRVHPQKIIVFGRSLGGAVALSLAARYQKHIAGFILENTFTNIGDMVDSVFPFLRPFKRCMLRIDWPNLKRIAAVSRPILFIAGQLDEIVPVTHMDRLYHAAVRSQRTFARFPSGSHNDTFMKRGYLETVANWLHSVFPDEGSLPKPELATAEALTDALLSAAGLLSLGQSSPAR